MAGSVKGYETLKPSEGKYGIKDVGRKISSERVAQFIDRVFAPSQREPMNDARSV